ncbi:hypoxanthine phosphoribosyltransferase [Fulvivirga sedimenti]|uniref:Hypoxanthine phosphoribosyltransferase n=1 Tax=Fulvivirga sedimenti TaxID=2879465 RepID=A0A9X1HTS9_9BACT|nr:hypoxanthine phosphoribosyltransferase [Fulvivirga sedimenti]MCA6078159.1 hypoxanthine phosphoribosyltransferase [Fulvivirga sedimenti]
MIIKDKKFVKLIDNEQIGQSIRRLARKINKDYKERNPLFIVVLNGAFMFAGDLMKEVKSKVRISFIKVSSYDAMESTGNIKQLIGLNENIFQQDVVIVEDIIDSGQTAKKVTDELQTLGARSVSIVTLLRKNKEIHTKLPVDYVGFDIENRFVVGYGLDYDGLGRNLKHIYALK